MVLSTCVPVSSAALHNPDRPSSFLLQSISNASRLFGSCLLAGHTVVTNSTACDTVIMFLLFTCPKFKKMTSQKSNLDYYVC